MIDWEEILSEDEDHIKMLRNIDDDIETYDEHDDLFKRIDSVLPIEKYELEYLIDNMCPYELDLNTTYEKAGRACDCTDGENCSDCWIETLSFNEIKVKSKIVSL